MTDRIVIEGMVFEGTHGVHEHEQRTPQPFEVDLELVLDLEPAGRSDDLERTIDYSAVFTTTRRIVETTSFRLIEALAQRIADEVLVTYQPDEVTVRIRKPAADLGGRFRAVGIEIVRRREAGPGEDRAPARPGS
jgi:7,8-dihydroneopterin aldolase/epimerase/oxygenase